MNGIKNNDVLVCWAGSNTEYAFSNSPEYGEAALAESINDAFIKYECALTLLLTDKGNPPAERKASRFAAKLHAINPSNRIIAATTDLKSEILQSGSFFALFCIAANPPDWLVETTSAIISASATGVDDFSGLYQNDFGDVWSIEGFVDSPSIRKQLSEITTVLSAPEEYNLPQCILITGETGVGKSRLAELLAKKTMPDKPYRHINCASLPAELADTILFGSVKGAYTGAENRAGYVEIVKDGILFLDELGELPIETQAHLLTLLDRKKYHRFGPPGEERSEYDVKCKFIFGTNRNLNREVSQGRFRDDLLHRINGCHIEIPPLRERIKTEAGKLFLESLISTLCIEHGHLRLTPRAEEMLKAHILSYDWPGNIRELKHFFQQLAIDSIRGNTNRLIPALHMKMAIRDHIGSQGAHLEHPREETANPSLIDTIKQSLPEYRHPEIDFIFDVAEKNSNCADAGKAFFAGGKPISNYSDAFSKKIKQLGLRWCKSTKEHLQLLVPETTTKQDV